MVHWFSSGVPVRTSHGAGSWLECNVSRAAVGMDTGKRETNVSCATVGVQTGNVKHMCEFYIGTFGMETGNSETYGALISLMLR